MKVFVYAKKKGSKKVQEINNVVSVYEDKKEKKITFQHTPEEGAIETTIDTRYFKTVTYQN